jgi:hypothetical protein
LVCLVPCLLLIPHLALLFFLARRTL